MPLFFVLRLEVESTREPKVKRNSARTTASLESRVETGGEEEGAYLYESRPWPQGSAAGRREGKKKSR